MKNAKRKRLENGGWKVGSVAEFLGLSDEEAALVELQLRSIGRPSSGGRSNLDRIRQTLSPSRRRAIAGRVRELIEQDRAVPNGNAARVRADSRRRGGAASEPMV